MNFRDLPGFPKLFLDYLDQTPAANAFFPCRPTLDSIQSHAAAIRQKTFPRKEVSSILRAQADEFQSGPRARENIQRLEQDNAVIVLTGLKADVFGGTLANFLKCLTAIKLAASLNERGFNAVPLAWVHSEDKSSHPVRVGDREERTIELENPASADVEKLIEQIEAFFDGLRQENETLQLLRQVYRHPTAPTTGLARLFAKLTGEWGLVLLDSASPGFRLLLGDETERSELEGEQIRGILDAQTERLEEAGYLKNGKLTVKDKHDKIQTKLAQIIVYHDKILPSLVHIANPEETTFFALSLPLYSLFDRQPPIVWPRVSATIVDNRSTKVLERYGVTLTDLFADSEVLLKKLVAQLPGPQIAQRLDTLSDEVKSKLAELETILPKAEESLKIVIEDSRTKMLYQLARLKERQVASHILRVGVMTRHLDRARTRLAPGGHLQENYLSGLHFLLEAPGVLREIYNQMDPWKMEHQILHTG